jgi:outer membrane protein assembly factor BamB
MRAYDTTYRSHIIGSAFNPYTEAPNTAHVVWTKPIAFGGLVGGEYGDIDYYTGLSYELKIWDKIIINGRLYYNTPDPPLDGFYCVDLRTGETIWKQEHGSIDLGQLYDYESPNQHGVIPYLWDVGSTYTLYDAFTGNPILSLANATTTSRRGYIFSKNGDLLLYMLDGSKNWLAMWNSSKAIPPPATTGTNSWQWRPDNYRGQTLDWRKGIQWNVTVPDVPGAQSLYELTSDTIIAKADLGFDSAGLHTYVDVAYSLKEGAEGRQLWTQNRTIAGGASIYAYPNWAAEGVYTVNTIETCETLAYDISTGQQLWATKPDNNNPWDIYKTGFIIAYGKYYWSGYANIYCYDLKNGTELWTYSTGNSGFETPYGTWPPYGGQLIADGKIYQNTGEHSPNVPLYRGERLHCINASTGEGIWSILGWFPQGAIADGYFVTLNVGDNQLYCFGKGQTATTVSASPEVSVHGNSVLIKGTVIDQSPGAKGTPAIADEGMSAWMEYLYMQQSMPTNATGVEVTLDALDPNGNFVHIGTVASDASGMFKKAFVPEVPGEYTIIATFAGSESYWRSYAETAIGVDEAPPATPPPEKIVFPPTETYVIGVGVAIIIAIAIVGILILRKK